MDEVLLSALFAFAIQAGGYTDFCRTSPACARPPAVVVVKGGEQIRQKAHGQVSPHRPNMVVISEAAFQVGPTWVEGVLIHEFVHVLQFASGRYEHVMCEGRAQMEDEAYRVQELYLRPRGMTIVNIPVANMREQCRRAREAGLIR